MAKEKTLTKFLNSQDYNYEFKVLMNDLQDKYGEEIMNSCGIGKQLDMGPASKKFFGIKNTADTSIDPNANVSDHSVISHGIEIVKPFHLVNSYYRIWKEIKKLKGVEYANKIVESQISGRLYINDFAGISSSKAYSYYKKTVLVVKYKGEIIYTTMEQLFNQFKDKVVTLPDMEVIDLTKVNIQILDDKNKFVKLTKVLRHKAHCGLVKLETKNGFTTIVTEDHPVILEDGSTKQGCEIVLGDRLKQSTSTFKFFQGSNEVDKLAYIVGFTIGDGYITGGNKEDRNYQFQIVQKNLQNNQVYSFIKDIFGEVAVRDKHNGTEYTAFGNKCLLCKYRNIQKGAENKKLPKDILNWDRNEVLSLIAGLIDADGCVNPQNGVIDIRIASFACVQQVAEILRWLGFSRVRTSLIDKNGTSGFESRLHLYRVSFVCNDMNLAEYSYKIQANKELVFKERQKDGRFETNEVRRILPFREEYVYDVTTETGHFHSQGLVQHNCYNYSTFDTALLGIPSEFDGRGGSKPPKNLMSFFGQIELFSLIAGNSTLGATGLADLLITASIFVDKMLQTHEDAHVTLETEENCYQYTESLLTGLIYRLNQPYRGSQSLFCNISIYDNDFIDNTIKDDAYSLEIDGVKYCAKKDIIQKLQIMYLDIMNREQNRKILTFPVTTACFSTNDNDEIIDEAFLDLISEKNLKFGFINMYCGKSSTLSSCCFTKNQLVRIKENDIERVTPIGTLEEGKLYNVYVGNDEYKTGKYIVRVHSGKFFKISTDNMARIECTDNHIFPTNMGDMSASEIAKCWRDGIRLLGEKDRFVAITNVEEIEKDDKLVFCFEMEDESDPYFMLGNGIRVHNCRLRSNRDGEWFSSLGASSSKIGSLGVSTGNLPHLAFECVKDAETRDQAREFFLERIKELVIDCQNINNAKRNIIKRTIKTGTLPMYSLGYISLKTQYSTFGVIGLNEALQILGLDIKTEEGQDFALKMLNIINNTNDELQKIFKAPHNCEQIPGENVAATLPKRDRMIGLNDRYDLYSNQFIPLTEHVNMFDRIKMQGLFDKYFSGGAICHLNMDQEIKDVSVMKNLIKASAKQGVVYFAINFVLQECEEGHLSVGNVDVCPKCGAPIKARYTRVVGFLSKVEAWNPTRREVDFPNRQFYEEIQIGN